MRDKADILLTPASVQQKKKKERKKARDGKLFWKEIKRQLTDALSVCTSRTVEGRKRIRG